MLKLRLAFVQFILFYLFVYSSACPKLHGKILESANEIDTKRGIYKENELFSWKKFVLPW